MISVNSRILSIVVHPYNSPTPIVKKSNLKILDISNNHFSRTVNKEFRRESHQRFLRCIDALQYKINDFNVALLNASLVKISMKMGVRPFSDESEKNFR